MNSSRCEIQLAARTARTARSSGYSSYSCVTCSIGVKVSGFFVSKARKVVLVIVVPAGAPTSTSSTSSTSSPPPRVARFVSCGSVHTHTCHRSLSTESVNCYTRKMCFYSSDDSPKESHALRHLNFPPSLFSLSQHSNTHDDAYACASSLPIRIRGESKRSRTHTHTHTHDRGGARLARKRLRGKR